MGTFGIKGQLSYSEEKVLYMDAFGASDHHCGRRASHGQTVPAVKLCSWEDFYTHSMSHASHHVTSISLRNRRSFHWGAKRCPPSVWHEKQTKLARSGVAHLSQGNFASILYRNMRGGSQNMDNGLCRSGVNTHFLDERRQTGGSMGYSR